MIRRVGEGCGLAGSMVVVVVVVEEGGGCASLLDAREKTDAEAV